MEKFINENNEKCCKGATRVIHHAPDNSHIEQFYKGVTRECKFSGDLFHKPNYEVEGDEMYALHTNIGIITVLDRMTGFGGGIGIRDTESGFRDNDGKFWLASGMCNVIESGRETIGEAIDWIKHRANTCIPNIIDKDN